MQKFLIFYYSIKFKVKKYAIFFKKKKIGVFLIKIEKTPVLFHTKKIVIIRVINFGGILMNKNAIVEELYGAIENHGLMNTLCAVFGKGCQIELGYTQKLCNTEVKNLDLSVRSYNALMRAGCHTVGQAITAINENSLPEVRNLGIKSIAEIRRLILEYGYSQLSDYRKKEFLDNLVKMNCKKGA